MYTIARNILPRRNDLILSQLFHIKNAKFSDELLTNWRQNCFLKCGKMAFLWQYFIPIQK